MPRFFSLEKANEGIIILTGEDAKHIAKSLRMEQGEKLVVCNGQGIDYLCEILSIDGNTVSVKVNEEVPSKGEANVKVTLYMSLPKSDKMELIAQKATELGVYEIIPVLTSRCISRPNDSAMSKKILRWCKICEEAAKQSGRGVIPMVHDVQTFKQAIGNATNCDLSLFLYESEHENGLKQALVQNEAKHISIFVGPEGGFSDEEAQYAVSQGLLSVSLGSRILRCETAPLAAISAIMYQTGNM